MAKELPVPPQNNGWDDLIKPKSTNITPANKTETISESEININNTSETKIESDNKPKINNKPNINPNTKHSTIIPKPQKKVKYTDSRIQRAYWYEKNLMKIFDDYCDDKENQFDKSEIMNNLLRAFLNEEGLLKK